GRGGPRTRRSPARERARVALGCAHREPAHGRPADLTDNVPETLPGGGRRRYGGSIMTFRDRTNRIVPPLAAVALIAAGCGADAEEITLPAGTYEATAQR